MKQVTVFGATGKIGSRIVRLLVEKNYQVVAFVHGPHNFVKTSKLKIVQGDIYNVDDVKKALKGSDVVISALGSWGTQRKDVLTAGMHAIIPVMEAAGMKRIITLTGADARVPSDKPGILHKFTHALFGAVVIKIMKDGEQHMRLLRASSLDWTTLRSPVMNDSGTAGNYVLKMKLPGLFATINRDDVAAAMVQLAEIDEYSHQAPIIYRK